MRLSLIQAKHYSSTTNNGNTNNTLNSILSFQEYGMLDDEEEEKDDRLRLLKLKIDARKRPTLDLTDPKDAQKLMVSILSEESEHRVYGKHCSYRHSDFLLVDSSCNVFYRVTSFK